MQTKTKCLCLLLIVCLAAGLLPGIALGQEEPEARYTTDEGQTWTEGKLIDLIDKCYSEPKATIQLLRDVVLTPDNWTNGKLLAEGGRSLTIDGQGHTLKRGEGIFIVGVVNKPASTVMLKNIIVDGGAVWEGDDPATRVNNGLFFDEDAPLFTVYGDSEDSTQGGTLFLESGAVLQNSHLKGDHRGAAVSVGRKKGGGGVLMMFPGAQIRDNAGYSGTVYVWKSGYFGMSGGAITGNYAANNGGGVCVKNGYLYMYDGEISGNKAKVGGGGVSLMDETSYFSIQGGSIHDNAIDGQKGGGVLLNKGTMGVSGPSVIRDNTDGNGRPNNVYLASDKILDITTTGDPLPEGMSIGVTTEVVPTAQAPVPIVRSLIGQELAPFFQSDGSYEFVTDDSKLLKLGAHMHVYEENAWKWDETTHWQVCAACDEETEPVAHTMVDEKCTVCGYVKPVVPPSPPPPPPVPDIPLTGDESRLMLWAGLLLLSGAGIVGLIICKRKGLFKR